MNRIVKLLILLSSVLLSENLLRAQTNPTAQTVPYTQDFSALAATSTTYPAGWQGWQLSTGGASTSFRTTAPTANINMTASGTASNNAGGIYNYNGKIGFLQSGSTDPSICLAINTTGSNGITVNYDVMTIRNPYDGSSNTRINEITLQYRIGTTGTFTTITGIEYQNNTTIQTTAVTTPQNLQSKSYVLPSACDNQSVVQLRWAARDVTGSGARASFALDNISISVCNTNTSTYYYRSLTSGNWSYSTSWEASPDGISGWIPACTPPTSAAALVTILSGHTITVDANSTAPGITINSGGTLTANSSSFVSLSISGNLTNNGTFQMVNGSFGVDVVFNKNGNQTVTGTGATTNFYSIGLNMGTSNSNILEISSTNFSGTSPLLSSNPKTSTTVNTLLNGTLKLSGSYSYTGTLLHTGTTSFRIPATAGIWLNNSNVNISSSNDSYDVSGLLKITAGTLNAGNTAGNSIRLLNNSSMIVQGGTVNVAGRIQSVNSGGTLQNYVTYDQSGGVVTLTTAGANSSTTIADFELDYPTDTLKFSGGTLVFRQQAATADDIYCNATSIISGGTIQIADALTTTATTAGFYIESYCALPSLYIYKPSSQVPRAFIVADLRIIGNIIISNGTYLNNSFPATPTYQDISLTGNWTNDGVFVNYNQKGVSFVGSTAQQISGTAVTNFNNLTINNTSSTGVTLNQAAVVKGNLSLTDGYLYTDNTNLLTMNAGAAVSSVSNSSFVYGPMAKIGDTDFSFPVGKDLEYRPIAATSLSASETFTAEYFHTDPDPMYSRSLKDASLDHLDGCEYWILNRAGTANANVTLSWDTYSCGVDSLPALSVARWDGSMWRDQGNGGTTGTSAQGTVISNGFVTSFSPFTLSSTTAAVNPLPIELLDFTANYQNPEVEIRWSTASEHNSNYFLVERSPNGTDFDELWQQAAAGTSSGKHIYSGLDPVPYSGWNYYRLKEVDYDGSYQYSSTVSVFIKSSGLEFTVFQNSSGNPELIFHQSVDRPLTISMMDAEGRLVFTTTAYISGNEQHQALPEFITKGLYLILVSDGKDQVSKKVTF